MSNIDYSKIRKWTIQPSSGIDVEISRAYCNGELIWSKFLDYYHDGEIDYSYTGIMPSFDEINACLTFYSAKTFTLSAVDELLLNDGNLEYSVDCGKTWVVWNGTAVTSVSCVHIHSGGTVYQIKLRGNNNTYFATSITEYTNFAFTGSGSIICIGNIETLLDYSTVLEGNHPIMADYAFANLFKSCSKLLTPPEFPATTLSSYCYYGIFYSCSTLAYMPKLPATTLAPYCYSYMFYYCKKLQCIYTSGDKAELPAMTLATYCYAQMFCYCTAIIEPIALPATNLGTYCYYNMFYYCTGIKIPMNLPATKLAAGCYNKMFNRCTSIKLSTTKVDNYNYEYRIPTTGSGTSATGAFTNMFKDTGGTFIGTPSINTTYYLDIT